MIWKDVFLYAYTPPILQQTQSIQMFGSAEIRPHEFLWVTMFDP